MLKPPLEDRVLLSLRRMARATDLHSKHLASTFGLTGPQLVCLRVIAKGEGLTQGELARQVSLSQATVTGIVDRLTARQLVRRQRSQRDRRLVSVRLTPAGKALVDSAPSPLQERFATCLTSLSEAERENIGQVLEQVVRMMDGEDLAVAPQLAGPRMLGAPPPQPDLDVPAAPPAERSPGPPLEGPGLSGAAS